MKSISIAGHEYEYHESDDLQNTGGEAIDGHYKVYERVIAVRRNLHVTYKKDVLMHEIVHGIMEHAGLEPSEQIANAIAYGLATVKIDGKPILRLPKVERNKK